RSERIERPTRPDARNGLRGRPRPRRARTRRPRRGTRANDDDFARRCANTTGAETATTVLASGGRGSTSRGRPRGLWRETDRMLENEPNGGADGTAGTTETPETAEQQKQAMATVTVTQPQEEFEVTGRSPPNAG